MCRALIALLLLTVSACATLGPLTEGSAPGLAWYVADMQLGPVGNASAFLVCSFSLVLKETQGTMLTFNEIKTIVYQPGTMPFSAVYRPAADRSGFRCARDWAARSRCRTARDPMCPSPSGRSS